QNRRTINIYLKQSLTDAEVAENSGIHHSSPLNNIEDVIDLASNWGLANIHLQCSFFNTKAVDLAVRGGLVFHLHGFTIGFSKMQLKFGNTVHGYVAAQWRNIKDLAFEMQNGNITYAPASQNSGAPDWKTLINATVLRGAQTGVESHIQFAGKGAVTCIDDNGDPALVGASCFCAGWYRGMPIETRIPVQKSSFGTSNTVFRWAIMVNATTKITEESTEPDDVHVDPPHWAWMDRSKSLVYALSGVNPYSLNHGDDVNC
ncbi:MAG: hypothetical protein KAG66_04055, partial [Methylococcales bacterium]|nr:hypothetical protein [Methylococcales bacterium]